MTDLNTIPYAHDVPWEDALQLIQTLTEQGLSDDDAIKQTAAFLDDLIHLDEVVPQPYGTVVEALDGEVLEMLLRLAWRWVKNAPLRQERRAKRQAGRDERKAARKAARKAK